MKILSTVHTALETNRFLVLSAIVLRATTDSRTKCYLLAVRVSDVLSNLQKEATLYLPPASKTQDRRRFPLREM